MIEAKARADKRYRLIKLSRNFGHQIAITVGLDHSAGRAVIVMDADLQDPPEVVLEMIAKWKEGYDVVSAERASRQGRKPVQAGDGGSLLPPHGEARRRFDAAQRRRFPPGRSQGARLLSRHARARPVRARHVRLDRVPPGNGDLRSPAARRGESKYSLRKMIGLAANGIISFSDAPLRLALWAGAAVSALAFIYGLSVIGRWALGDPSLERGWSSTIVIIAALGGANMLMTGVIGLYVGRIYAEAKGRPLYIVERAVGFEDAPTAARRPAATAELARRETSGSSAKAARNQARALGDSTVLPMIGGWTDGAAQRSVHARPHCHRARFALYPREARPDGPVAQWLEPAAHNGLVAGSKSCPAHQPPSVLSHSPRARLAPISKMPSAEGRGNRLSGFKIREQGAVGYHRSRARKRAFPPCAGVLCRGFCRCRWAGSPFTGPCCAI